MSNSKEYDEPWYCPNCDKETPHHWYDSGHERDGSNDWRKCLACGWRYSGMTGEYHPPYSEESN